jgi:hypothetical protein
MQGEVRRAGRVPTEAAAARAIARALDVDGVVRVVARLDSDDAPAPLPSGGALWCDAPA